MALHPEFERIVSEFRRSTAPSPKPLPAPVAVAMDDYRAAYIAQTGSLGCWAAYAEALNALGTQTAVLWARFGANIPDVADWAYESIETLIDAAIDRRAGSTPSELDQAAHAYVSAVIRHLLVAPAAPSTSAANDLAGGRAGEAA